MADRIEVIFDELVLRASEGGDGRTLEGYIVPWNKPALVQRPVPGWESYKRGAVTRSIQESKQPIPLMGHHSEAGMIGKMTSSEDDATGQLAVFRLFDTQAARDAMELVREGVLTGLSIGGTAVPARTQITKGADGRNMIVRSEIRLDHVGLVRTPAFTDARVLALRSADEKDFAAIAAARKRARARKFA